MKKALFSQFLRELADMVEADSILSKLTVEYNLDNFGLTIKCLTKGKTTKMIFEGLSIFTEDGKLKDALVISKF